MRAAWSATVHYAESVLSESGAGESQPRPGASAFWWRLTDNFFRRIVWYLLPIVALTVVGVMQASSTLRLFASSGTLSAASNPLVPDQPISGVTRGIFETPASATSRIINERLRTDSFLLSVADRAGLTEAIESGLINVDIVRASVWASANGDSILTVNARWADPQTTYELVAATIDEYEMFLNESVASDSTAAEAFYTEQLRRLETQRDQARAVLDEYAIGLPEPEGDEYPVAIQLELDRLAGEVQSVEDQIMTAQQRLDEARLARAQQTTEAGRSFTIIDPPRVPTSPESVLIDQATTVISFAVLGAVIAAAALVLTTALDRTIASPADVRGMAGIPFVTTVPKLAELTPSGRRRAADPTQGDGGDGS